MNNLLLTLPRTVFGKFIDPVNLITWPILVTLKFEK